MNVFLLLKGREFDAGMQPPWQGKALEQDLGLNTLFETMAGGDEFLYKAARAVMFAGLSADAETILYRQEILKACLANAALVQTMYDLAVEALEDRHRQFLDIFTKFPSAVLSGAVGRLDGFLDCLKKLREIGDQYLAQFHSEGFARLFRMLQSTWTDDYLSEVHIYLTELGNSDELLIGAQLGAGNKGGGYRLERLSDKRPGWFRRMFISAPRYFSFALHPRDEGGLRVMSEMKDEAKEAVAARMAAVRDLVLGFMRQLRTELAFYLGCIRLRARLSQLEMPVCFPSPIAFDGGCTAKGLYDCGLALNTMGKVVGNDFAGEGRRLVIITGANQGGKSTFLRSVGVAQVMMQCGMFVPGVSFDAPVYTGIFTHFKREEDSTMSSGKLEEELRRMSDIADHFTPGSLLLFNEFFSATNEREGSAIAEEVVRALMEKTAHVFYVTHLYLFAQKIFAANKDWTLFLRAERQADGRRTFKLIEAGPLETSYAADLYEHIMNE